MQEQFCPAPVSSLTEGPTTTEKEEKVSFLSALVTLMAVIFLPNIRGRERRKETRGKGFIVYYSVRSLDSSLVSSYQKKPPGARADSWKSVLS